MEDAIFKGLEPKTQEESVAVIDSILAEIDKLDARMDCRRKAARDHWARADQLKKLEQKLDKRFIEQVERVGRTLDR